MKKRLYTGLDAPSGWIHYPVIKIVPQIAHTIPDYTHVIFTSKSAVKILYENFGIPKDKVVISVGQQTTKALNEYGLQALTASEETAEGVVSLLETLPLDGACIYWPHSALSRSVLPDYFKKRGLRYTDQALYDTVLNNPGPLPDLAQVDEIHFTSPSTVDNFLMLCPTIPPHIKLTAIGPVTKQHLLRRREGSQTVSVW